MSATTAVSDELQRAIRAASRWYVRVQSGDERAGVELARWLDASPLHQRAWQEVQQAMAPLGKVPSQMAAPMLRGAAVSRRQMLRRLFAVAAVAQLPWLASRNGWWPAWGADMRTATGERARHTLADGSLLALDTDSAVDVRFTSMLREVMLQRGEILIETAKDAQPLHRPFVVTTRHGSVTALGTRFVVRVDAERTRVSVLDKAVRVAPASSGERIEIGAGEHIVFDEQHCEAPTPADASAGSWLNGSVVAVDMPLGELVAELGRYRPGMLSCDPEVAALKVSGAFPIDDTERALRVLTDAFPLRLQRVTRYWVRVVPV